MGFSDKKTVKGHAPVGVYGIGFKSGSMHLGKDAIVFSKKGESMCVGMLSQTYLQGMDSVVVPIVTFKRIGESIRPESQHEKSLQAILQNSLFQKEEELVLEFDAITQDSSGSTGTRIIIWNLSKESEFDFETDRYDIQIPDVYDSDNDKYKRSLRAYCSVLYLKPRMQIIIRGQKVKTQLIAKTLAHAVKEKYIPSFVNDKRKSVLITFGFNTESQEHYGVMMYHKNRLIKAYERVRCQNRANKKGVGVIAVIECNFLTPTHNKQDFDCTDKYRITMNALDKKLEEYWNVMYHKIGQNGTVPLENILTDLKQKWVQCDDCRKWRKITEDTDNDKVPEKWFCHMNSDKRFRSCDEPEEHEVSEDETYQQEKKNLKIQQKLKKKQGPLQLSLPTASLKTDITASSPIDFSSLLPSASSSSDNMQATSHTFLTRAKRSLGQTNSQAQKKKRALNDYCNNSPDSPLKSTFTSDVLTSQVEITDNNESLEEVESNTVDDDVVFISETKSMARPKTPIFNLDKLKLERSTSNDVHNSNAVSMETHSTEGAEDVTMDPLTSNDQVRPTKFNMTVTMKEKPLRRREEVEKKGDEVKNKATGMEQNHNEVKCRNNKGTKNNRSITKDPADIEGCSGEVLSPMPEEAAMVSGLYNMATLKAQTGKDSLLELESLALKLKNKELLERSVKKEFSHQNTQTDPLEKPDYKTRYLREKRCNKQLKKTKNNMMKKQKEILLQMKAEKEAQDRMKAELETLKERDSLLTARCEQLEKDLDKLTTGREESRNGTEENGTNIASSTQTSQHCNIEDSSANHVNQIKEVRETNESPAEGASTVTAAKKKRSLGQTKRTARVREKSRAHNDNCNKAPDSPSMSTFVQDVLTSQMEILDNNESADKVESTDYDDDDVVINENKSTPRPKDSFC